MHFGKRKAALLLIAAVFCIFGIALGVWAFSALPETNLLRSDWLWLSVGVAGVAGLWTIVIIERRKKRNETHQ